MNECKECEKEFGAPATLRIHENTSCEGKVEKVEKKAVKPKKK